MAFEIVGKITAVTVIATGSGSDNSPGCERHMAKATGVNSTSRSTSPAYLLCVDSGASDDLQVRRLYRVIPDPAAARSDYVRVVDDSGEDHLYPASCFIPLELPQPAHVALGRLAR